MRKHKDRESEIERQCGSEIKTMRQRYKEGERGRELKREKERKSERDR